MIGAGYLQSTTTQAGGDYTVIVSPAEITTNTPNGSYNSPLLTATPVNGVGPFEYNWFGTFEFPISNPTERTTTFSISGFDRSIFTQMACRVTDLGNGSISKTGNCFIALTFE